MLNTLLIITAITWSVVLAHAAYGAFSNEPLRWAKAFEISPPTWAAIAWVNAIHSFIWACIAVSLIMEFHTLAIYLSIFTFGMMLTDLLISIPLYSNLNKNDPLLFKANFKFISWIIVLIQGGYCFALMTFLN